MLKDGPAESWIKVHDPEDEGEKYTSEEADAALLGVVRLHMGNLLARLGHQELAAGYSDPYSGRDRCATQSFSYSNHEPS